MTKAIIGESRKNCLLTKTRSHQKGLWCNSSIEPLYYLYNNEAISAMQWFYAQARVLPKTRVYTCNQLEVSHEAFSATAARDSRKHGIAQ